nr:hypothetical protein [Tanacetum cinerariifolium]
AAIRALIARGVADALDERTIQRNTNLNGDGSQGSGSGITRPVRLLSRIKSSLLLALLMELPQHGRTPMSRQDHDATYSMP